MELKTQCKIKWDSLSPEEREEERKKCEDSASYFYNNYMRPEGARKITDDEIKLTRKQAESVHIIRGRKGNNVYLYPKTYEEAFK